MHNRPQKLNRPVLGLHLLGLPRLKALVILGAVGTVPLLSPPTTAEAAPKLRDQIHDNANITVSGIVQRDLVGNDRFTVRLDGGRTVQVIDRRREPVRLSHGDRVELRGDFENGLFIADRVRIVRNNGGRNNGGQNVVRGTVARDYAGREFALRLNNARIVTVRAERTEPLRLTRGDRVEVRGHYAGSIFMARDVTILRNDDRREVNFTGTVVRREGYNRLIVRADNRLNYTVTVGFSLSRFDDNDRVRVVGIVKGNAVTASRIELLRDR